MGRPRAQHGTSGGYRGHKDRKERVCDACQAWKDAERADAAPPKARRAVDPGTSATMGDIEPFDENVDYVQETLSNLAYIERAMKTAAADKIGPLSKRKSELLRELKEYRAELGDDGTAVDPIDAALDISAAAGPDMSNVTVLQAASA